MQKIQGWAEEGNITVAIAGTGYVSSNKAQGSFPGCTVTIYNAGTLVTPFIYEDDADDPTIKANPFVVGDDGIWFAYVPTGTYDVAFNGGGIAIPFTVGDVPAGTGGGGIPSFAYESLPGSKPQNAGNLARVNNKTRGIWMDTGSQWTSTNGRNADAAEFGMVGDWDGSSGTANIAALDGAVQAVKDNGGGTVWIPGASAPYLVGGNFNLASLNGVSIRAVPRSFDFAAGTQPSTLVFDVAGHGIKITNCTYLNLSGLAVDGLLITENPIYVDRLTQSFWDSISVVNCVDTAYRFTDTSGTGAVQFNTFLNLNAETSPVCLELNGVPDVSGCYHNTFTSFRGGYNGAAGIQLVNCDNIKFDQTFLYRDSGAGYSVDWIDNSISHPPNSIYFYHLESGGSSGAGELHRSATCVNWGGIFGYDRSNGGPVASNSFIGESSGLIMEVGAGSTGSIMPIQRRVGGITQHGETAGTWIQDDDDLGEVVRNDNNGNAYLVRLENSDRGVHFLIDAFGANAFVESMVVRYNGLLTAGPMSPGDMTGAFQSGQIYMGSAAPNNSVGNNGDLYIKTSGTAAGKTIFYHKEAGSWVAAIP